MRYIKKQDAQPAMITDWITQQTKADLPVSYSNFRDKEALNHILRAEQKHICCYCQQYITHYERSNKPVGSHNEHFIPQHGVYADPSKQLDYYNLYACCNYSKGQRKSDLYCGESKHDSVIRAFIQETNCTDFFKYNINGEILPAGTYSSFSAYKKNRHLLTSDQKDALEAIEVLNLNCSYLMNKRKNLTTALIRILNAISQERVMSKITAFDTMEKHYKFVDMLLYYMKKKR